MAISANAYSEEKQTPTDAFRGETQHQLFMCRIQEKIAANKIEMGETGALSGLGECIKNGKLEVKKTFAPALKVVAKNSAASKILKDYYGAWLTALNGVMPDPGERKIDYERR